MQGTVPSADKRKYQMVHDQRAGPSPGTAWSRKHIITDVDSLASDSAARGKTHLVFKCKEKNRSCSLQTEHLLVLLLKFWIQIDTLLKMFN